jgi:hypothetical protein
MGSGWIFLFCHKGTTGNIKKDKGAAMNESPAKSKKYDKLVTKWTPEGHCSLFLYLFIHRSFSEGGKTTIIKIGCNGLAYFLLAGLERIQLHRLGYRGLGLLL